MSHQIFRRPKSRKMLAMYAIEHGATAAAQRFGISRSKVYDVFRRLGWLPPSLQPKVSP